MFMVAMWVFNSHSNPKLLVKSVQGLDSIELAITCLLPLHRDKILEARKTTHLDCRRRRHGSCHEAHTGQTVASRKIPDWVCKFNSISEMRDRSIDAIYLPGVIATPTPSGVVTASSSRLVPSTAS